MTNPISSEHLRRCVHKAFPLVKNNLELDHAYYRMFSFFFRDECEELRYELSKRTRDEIFKDREKQIEMKAEAKNREIETERFYAEIWEQDRLAKAEREELEMREQIERNRSALEVWRRTLYFHFHCFFQHEN